MALVSSRLVMPLSILIETPCIHMCLRSVAAGAGLGVAGSYCVGLLPLNMLEKN